MSRYISESYRILIAQRASGRCEYCRVHERDLHFVFQIDHVVSIKHGGKTILSNLAYCCVMCNLNKGSDLGTYLSESLRLTRLFNPRRDRWKEHFEAIDGEIIAITKIGEATVKILDLNQPDRLILRRVLTHIGEYP